MIPRYGVISLIQRFIRAFPPDIQQFIRFSIVGVCNSIIDFSLYITLLSFNVYYLAAHGFAWMVAVCFSFVMNKYWTFRSFEHKVIMQQYTKFFIVNAVGLGLSTMLLYFFVDYLNVSKIIGKILAIGIVLFWNFFMNKLWTFQRSA